MANLLRCDRCKGLSDGEGPDKAYGIADSHWIKVRITTGNKFSEHNIKITHTTLHLCQKCIKEAIAEGNFSSKPSYED